MKNPLKTKLKEGKRLFGIAVTIAHPDVAEIVGHLGYDWALFDTEHSPLDIAAVQNLMQAMSFSKTAPIVRVAWNDAVLMKRALDIGAYGIIVPWVNSKEDALRAVQAIRYPPEGIRGWGPRRAALADPDYTATANEEIFLGVQIETQTAIDNVDEILSVPGVDAAFIGPFDLSMSLGVFGQWTSTKFGSTVKRILNSSLKHRVTPGVLAPVEWQKRLKEGFRMLLISIDTSHLSEGGTKTLAEARVLAQTLM